MTRYGRATASRPRAVYRAWRTIGMRPWCAVRLMLMSLTLGLRR